MKARKNDGMLTISEIKKFEAVIVRTKVTTFALELWRKYIQENLWI
jgi:hypothetical protein